MYAEALKVSAPTYGVRNIVSNAGCTLFDSGIRVGLYV